MPDLYDNLPPAVHCQGTGRCPSFPTGNDGPPDPRVPYDLDVLGHGPAVAAAAFGQHTDRRVRVQHQVRAVLSRRLSAEDGCGWTDGLSPAARQQESAGRLRAVPRWDVRGPHEQLHQRVHRPERQRAGDGKVLGNLAHDDQGSTSVAPASSTSFTMARCRRRTRSPATSPWMCAPTARFSTTATRRERRACTVATTTGRGPCGARWARPCSRIWPPGTSRSTAGRLARCTIRPASFRCPARGRRAARASRSVAARSVARTSTATASELLAARRSRGNRLERARSRRRRPCATGATTSLRVRT